jgi:hypothetical protein
MKTNRISMRLLGAAAVLSAGLMVTTVDVRVSPTAARPIELSFVAEAHAFDPIGWVWDKFKNGVLDKVFNFIKSPIEKAKNALKSLIDKAINGLKNIFMTKVLAPAAQWALEKIFPGAEKFLAYAQELIGKVDTLMNMADKYAAAVDAIIMKQADRFKSVIGEVDNSMDVIQKFNVSMVVDIAIAYAKEKADSFIKAKTIELLNKAFDLVEGPINMGKAAACSAIGSIPIVGGLLRGAVDFLITQGLALMRTKGFEFIADEAVKLANRVIDAIGSKLKGVAAKVDDFIAPVLDKLKGFIAKVASFVAPIKDAFSKVKNGLMTAQQTLATLKSAAQGAAGQK